MFGEYVRLSLASAVAFEITKDRGVERDMLVKAGLAKTVATAEASANEGPKRLFGNSPWTAARRNSGFFFRDERIDFRGRY